MGRLSASFGAFGSHFGELEPKHGQTQGITRPCTAGRAFYAESKFGLAISVANTGTKARPCPTRSTAVFPPAAGRVIKPGRGTDGVRQSTAVPSTVLWLMPF
ncbi:unnamed protein product [Linum trigynum]|uniref:Uncharacterized protein n=1 Tax=Linum trigynum TaxID=586398 RepID=A0AAV2ET72_9ROSI